MKYFNFLASWSFAYNNDIKSNLKYSEELSKPFILLLLGF